MNNMKNIVCLDIETTGVDISKDRIVQLSMVKFDPNTYDIIDTFDKYIKPSGSYTMSLTAVAKHRITPKFLEDKPEFKDIYKDILGFIENSGILGYNLIRFDLPLIQKEFERIGYEWHFNKYDIWDAFIEEKRRNGNTLSDTFLRYTGKTMEECGYSAHNSFSDVKATIDIFKYQMNSKIFEPENIVTESGFINLQVFNNVEYECFSVGKYSGIPVQYVVKNDKSYIEWILNNQNFDNDVKEICRKYMNKI